MEPSTPPRVARTDCGTSSANAAFVALSVSNENGHSPTMLDLSPPMAAPTSDALNGFTVYALRS